MTVLAIDFGTTRTKVACFDPELGAPRLIELGHEVRGVIPSLFYIPRDGQPLVGDDAQQMVNEDPEGIVVGLKKEIHKLGKYRFGGGRPSVDRKELAAHLFRYVRERCEREEFHGESITECVLTVPVAFEDQKRDSIRDAARQGGFETISLVEEPVAAARAWLARTGQKIAQHIVVCDVGGGTTDFALLRHTQGKFETDPKVPPVGFSQGGNDLDEAILTQLLDEGVEEPDAVEERRSGFLVRMQRARETLSRDVRRGEVSISLSGATLKVPRDVVQGCAAGFIEMVVEELKKFLNRCREASGVTEPPVLLVGGGSRTAGLREAIEPLAAGRVFQWTQSDYATVLGAVERPATRPAARPETQSAAAAPSEPETPSSPRITRTLVLEMIGDGLGPKALDIVARALVSHPTDDVFDLWQKAAEVSPASVVLDRARDIHRARHGDMWSIAVLACALADANRRDEAKLTLRPSTPDDHASPYPLQFAWCAVLTEDDHTYHRLLDDLLKRKPDNPLLLAHKAAGFSDKDPAQASELFEKALSLHRSCLTALEGRAILRINEVADREQLAAMFRADLTIVERIAADHSCTRTLRALYRSMSGDYQSAKAELDVLVQDPRVLSIPDAIAGALTFRARIYAAMNDAAAARRDVDEALRYSSKYVDAIFMRGEFLNQDGSHDAALACIDRGLAIAPTSFEGRTARAWALFGLGRFDAAAREFEATAKLQPTNVDAVGCATFGKIMEVIGASPEQLQQLNGYLFIAPNIPEDKLTLAKQKLVGDTPGDSLILLLYDATAFSSFDQGFYITERHVVSKAESDATARSGRLQDILKADVSLQNLGVWLNDRSTLLPMANGMFWDGSKMRPIIRRLMLELAELHRSFEKR